MGCGSSTASQHQSAAARASSIDFNRPEFIAQHGFVVLVDVCQARHVAKLDLLTESDVYIRASVPLLGDGQDGVVEKRTHTVSNSSHPIFNTTLTFDWLDAQPETLTLVAMDEDTLTKDDYIGEVTVELGALWDLAEAPYRWLALKSRATGETTCELQVRVRAVSMNPDVAEQLEHYCYTHLLGVNVERLDGISSAKAGDLPGVYGDLYVRVHWGTKQMKTRTVPADGGQAEWGEQSFFWANQATQGTYFIKFEVYDHDVASQDDLVGEAMYAVEEFFAFVAAHANDEFDAEAFSKTVKLPLSKLQLVTDKDLGNAQSVPVEEGNGVLTVTVGLQPKQQVEERFFRTVLEHFDADRDGLLTRGEFDSMLTALGIDLPTNQLDVIWGAADRDANGSITPDESLLIMRSLLFVNADSANRVLHFLHGGSTIHSSLMEPVKAVGDSQLRVMDRTSGLVVSENIPRYIQVAFTLMFKTQGGRGLTRGIAPVLSQLSKRQGAKYDDPASRADIEPFIALHGLNVDEIKEPLDSFGCFNEFFFRELKPEARPIFEPDNPRAAVCPADCRLIVFPEITDATRLWIKGSQFTVENVLGGPGNELVQRLVPRFKTGSMAIARLAPQDYHRWHVPVDGTASGDTPIDGALYTVNPVAVNRDVNVYTANKRRVLEIDSDAFGKVVMVAVGATMVGSIVMLKQPGDQCAKGDQHGYFKFGGSTVLLFFEQGRIEFAPDLLANSRKRLETLVQVNSLLGRAPDA